MATYERTTQKHATANYFTDALVLSEQMVYGSKRLGNHAPNFTLLTARANFTAGTSPKLNNTSSFSWTNMVAPSFDRSKRVVNDKFYELSNHLGNVLVVVSDRKKGTTDNGSSVYVPEIVSYSDYSPFGTQLHLRHGSSEGYRYGFQGQEIDSEIKGEGNSVNYTFRMHDPRIGRFFAIDPLIFNYPMLTPYQFSSNSPIYLIEIEGLEGTVYLYKRTNVNGKTQETLIKTYTVDGLKSDIKKVGIKPNNEPNGKTIKYEYSLVMPDNQKSPVTVTRNISKGEKRMDTKEINQTFGNNLAWQNEKK